MVGDFNNDGRDDVAEFFPETNVGWNASQAVGFESRTLPHVDGLMGLLLPYMEQDSIYNMAGNGSSPFVAAVHLDLLGLHVDTSPIDVEIRGIDVWEHAYLQDGPSTNGIIAVLIGLRQDVTDGTSNTMMLTVDPSDASGNTLLRVDTTNARGLAASLLASDEFFARFAGTTFGDEAAAVVAGRSGKVAQVTHDREFDNWTHVKGFDRGYLPPGSNSILHEENEFSFPRMIRGV